MQPAFYQSELDQPHPARTRAIMKAHPEVRQLMTRNPSTALIAVTIVVLQTAIAFWMGKLGMGYWWLGLLVAYLFGAFANHCAYVIIHDAAHNLVFQAKNWNRLIAILAGKPVLFGPHMENFSTLAQALVANEAAIQISDPNSLHEKIAWLLRDPEAALRLVANAQAVLARHSGATGRTATLVTNLESTARFPVEANRK